MQEYLVLIAVSLLNLSHAVRMTWYGEECLQSLSGLKTLLINLRTGWRQTKFDWLICWRWCFSEENWTLCTRPLLLKVQNVGNCIIHILREVVATGSKRYCNSEKRWKFTFPFPALVLCSNRKIIACAILRSSFTLVKSKSNSGQSGS